MTQNQNQFFDRNDDLRNKNLTNDEVSASNDDLGENTEQTPAAKAYTESSQQKTEAERKGWDNNKPGITTNNENDERIPTVTPYNENGTAGPDEDDDVDLDEDDEDYDELIPTEGDDDDLEEEDDIVDKNADQHIDLSKVGANTSSRSTGRTSGRMIDHEPGITGQGDNDRYDTTR